MVNPLAASDFFHAAFKVLLFGSDDVIGACAMQKTRFLRPARGGDHCRAGILRDLQPGERGAAARCRDQHDVVGRHAGMVDEPAPCRAVLAPDRTRLDRRNRLGIAGDAERGHHRALAVKAVLGHRIAGPIAPLVPRIEGNGTGALADGEAGDPGAQRIDHAACLDPDTGGEGGVRYVCAVPKHDLRPVEADRLDLEADLALARFFERLVVNLQDLGAAVTGEPDDAGHAADLPLS